MNALQQITAEPLAEFVEEGRVLQALPRAPEVAGRGQMLRDRSTQTSTRIRVEVEPTGRRWTAFRNCRTLKAIVTPAS